MKKNDIVTGVVCDLGSNGEGIVKIDNTVCFVPYTLVGEKVKFKALKVTSKCVYGKLIEVLTPGDLRVRPVCPVFTKCGGCQLQHVKYNAQLKLKEKNIVNVFRKVADIDIKCKPCVKGDDCFRYRNKLQLPVISYNGETKIGFYAENSHRVVEISDCPINANWTINIISAFSEYIKRFNIQGYDEANHTGEIREITVKDIKDNLIITVVTLKETLRFPNDLIEILKSKLHNNFSLYQNINNNDTNVIFGNTFKLLYGSPDYTGDMLGIKYKIGVRSFMQVNNVVCSKLYSKVKDLVGADENTVVIDAYSGAGLMTALLAKDAKKAIGVEIIKEAVDCADELAKFNKLDKKITNYCGKCEDILPEIIEKEKKNNSEICVVLDPPRKGCDKKVINALINCDIDRIVYVSCMPSTLARDVGLLTGTLKEVDGQLIKTKETKLRYSVDSVRPYDMFSQTKHVETIVELNRIV